MAFESKEYRVYSLACKPSLIVKLLCSLQVYSEICLFDCLFSQSPGSGSELMGHKRHSQYLLIILVTWLNHISVTLRKPFLIIVLPDRYLIQTGGRGHLLFYQLASLLLFL